MKPKEAFSLLGVSENASEEETKKAYKLLALQFHPDKCKTLAPEKATEKFQQVKFNIN